jgi:RHS repeat-associated protein
MPIARNAQPLKPSVTDIRSPRTLLLASDLQQSVLAELDRSGPNPFAYSPYGLQSGLRRSETRLGFNGQFKEGATGWYHLGNGHRVYNPGLMRFYSPDRLSPFGRGGVNAYAYCQGDPVNYTDPTGQWALLALVQRGLTVALHSVVPIGMILGPKVSGVALGATRFSLAGSIGSGVGAVMQIAGYTAGAYVSAVGTTALLAGAATRGAVALKNAYQSNVFWKTLKDNVKNVVGLGDSPTVIKPSEQLDAVVIGNPPEPNNLTADVRDIRR